jgi:hypothetical protein
MQTCTFHIIAARISVYTICCKVQLYVLTTHYFTFLYCIQYLVSQSSSSTRYITYLYHAVEVCLLLETLMEVWKIVCMVIHYAYYHYIFIIIS